MRKPYNLAKAKATSELEMFLLSSEINDNIATNACFLSLFQRESKKGIISRHIGQWQIVYLFWFIDCQLFVIYQLIWILLWKSSLYTTSSILWVNTKLKNSKKCYTLLFCPSLGLHKSVMSSTFGSFIK